MVKENIHTILQGFQRDPCLEEDCERGYDLYQVRGWDYPALLETYASAAEIARQYHIPQLVHVIDVTQPQGHSTSGSHERYKTPERLKWEQEYDCIRKMREWMIENGVATEPELVAAEKEDHAVVEGIRKLAWEAYLAPILEERGQVMDMLDEIAGSSSRASELEQIKERLAALPPRCAVTSTAPRMRPCASCVRNPIHPSRCSSSGRTSRMPSTISVTARICIRAERLRLRRLSRLIPAPRRP
jgi:hypothetical protein